MPIQGVSLTTNQPVAVAARISLNVPLVIARAPAGFPSPADDYLDKPLDFNELLITNPAATFAVRVTGDSMIGAGIFPHDIAVIDRSRTASDGSIIIALLDGEFTLKRYRQRGGRRWLQAQNPNYADIELSGENAFEVWGCVKAVVRVM